MTTENAIFYCNNILLFGYTCAPCVLKPLSVRKVIDAPAFGVTTVCVAGNNMIKPAHALSSHIPYLDILDQVVHKLYKIDIALQFCHDA